MLILYLKVIHVVGAMMFLGAGGMSAYYKLRADTSGDPAIVAWYQRELVRSDWLVIVPSGIILPVTGLWMMRIYPRVMWYPWAWYGVVGFTISGLLWLPAAFLQIRMRKLAEQARDAGTELPEDFHRANRMWAALGVPSFLAAAFTVWLMVAKNSFGG